MGGQRRRSVSGTRRHSVAGTSSKSAEDPYSSIDGSLGSLLKRRVSELVRNPELRAQVTDKLASQESKERSSEKPAIPSESSEAAHSDLPVVPYPVVKARSIEKSAAQTVQEPKRRNSKHTPARKKKIERSRSESKSLSESKDVETPPAHIDDMAHQCKEFSDMMEELKRTELPKCILNVLDSIEKKMSSYASLFSLATTDLLALEELSKTLDMQSSSTTQLLSTWAEQFERMQKNLQQELSRLDPASRRGCIRWLPAVEHCLVKLGIISKMVDAWKTDVKTTSEDTATPESLSQKPTGDIVTPGKLLHKPIATSPLTRRRRNSAPCNHYESPVAESDQQNPQQNQVKHNSDNDEHGTVENSELPASDHSDCKAVSQHEEKQWLICTAHEREEDTPIDIDSNEHRETPNQSLSDILRQQGWKPLSSDNPVGPCLSTSVASHDTEQGVLGEYPSVTAQPDVDETCSLAFELPSVPASPSTVQEAELPSPAQEGELTSIAQEEMLLSCGSTEEGQGGDLTESSTPETLGVDAYCDEKQEEERTTSDSWSSFQNQKSSQLECEEDAPTATPKRESPVPSTGKHESEMIAHEREHQTMETSDHSLVPATAINASAVSASESLAYSSGHAVLENPCVQATPACSFESITGNVRKRSVAQPYGQRPKYHRPRAQYKLEDLDPLQERLRNAILIDDSSPLQLMEIVGDYSKNLPQIPDCILGSLRRSSSSKRMSISVEPHTVLPAISRRRSWG